MDQPELLSDEGETAADAARSQVDGRRVLLVGVAIVVAAMAGYLVGWSRGSADLDRGVSATTSIVAPAPGGNPVAPAPTTAPTPAPTAEVEVPLRPITVVSFDDGIPDAAGDADVTSTPGWTTDTGAARPPTGEAEPAGDAGPPQLGQAPSIIATSAGPITLVTVDVRTPAAGTSIAIAIDGDDRWQLAISADSRELVLYEVRDDVAEQRGALNTEVAPGTQLGLFLVDESAHERFC